MAGHRNATLVRKGFAAFEAGDVATLNTLFTDDIVWHAAGRSFLGGDFAGKGAVLGVFARLTQEADSFQQKVHSVLADGEHAVALVEADAARGDRKTRMRQVFVFHFSGGRICEAWVSAHDQYAADEFWADAGT
jgi:ketosteroid isomerase-like protein